MIDLHDLKPGNRIGFKVTMGRETVYGTGAITTVEKDHVRIDELVLRKKDLVPILLTADTLIKLGCEELSAKHWRTPHFTDFEFDGIQLRIGDGGAPMCYLHLFQNMVAQLGEELVTNV